MSTKYFVQRFNSTLQLLQYQWNIISKETLNNIKNTYNKPSKPN